MDHETFRRLRGVTRHESVPFAGGKDYKVCSGSGWAWAMLTPRTAAAGLLGPGSGEHCQETAGLRLTVCGDCQGFSIGPPATPFSQPGQKHLVLKGQLGRT